MTSLSIGSRADYPRQVFCNRNLRLDRIRQIGFDMDYTLALYEVEMEHLQAEMVLERLVQAFGYPERILDIKYQPAFAIRGLAVDVVHGNVFKMDTHRFVTRAWHGSRALEREERRALYSNRKISPADSSIMMVDTLFSFPEISLYCQLVARLDELQANAKSKGVDTRFSYERLFRDLRSAMDTLHRDNTLKARILADIPRYVTREPGLADTLHRFRASGKRLFIVTNSEPHYTDAVMRYLLEGQHPDYATWRDYFDVVITSAGKPTFFEGNAPFYEVDSTLHTSTTPATELKPGGMYSGGNVQDLSRMCHFLGDDTLYVGDHIYGDILRSKRSTMWRTAMIVPEMERELALEQDMRDELVELDQLEEARFQLELDRGALSHTQQETHALDAQIAFLSSRAIELQRHLANRFNPVWGQLFRDRTELSTFGKQIEDYACVYTSRVSNFGLYSPSFYFRSPRDRMAHELTR